jgi:hypothetical protein
MYDRTRTVVSALLPGAVGRVTVLADSAINTLEWVIPVPAYAGDMQPTDIFASFDTSLHDPATRTNNAAERSNTGAHMISATFTVAGQAIRIIAQQATTFSPDVDAVLPVTDAGGGNRTGTLVAVAGPVRPMPNVCPLHRVAALRHQARRQSSSVVSH